MHGGVAAILLLLAAAPLICAVDFVFYYRLARQRPSFVWLVAFALPWGVLVLAAAAGVNAMMPVAFVLAGALSFAWLVRRNRRR